MTPETEVVCPVCAAALLQGEAVQRCPRCDTPAHRDCWEYVGGCAIFGCTAESAVARVTPGAVEEASLGSRLDLGATAGLLSTYAWTLRLHWWAFAGFNLGLASLVPFGLMAPLGQLLAFFSFLMVVGGVVAYLFLTVPLFLLTSLLEMRLSLSLKVPKKGIRGVLDRVEFAPAESQAKRLVDLAPRIYVLGLLLGGGWTCYQELFRHGLTSLFPLFSAITLAAVFGYLPILFLRRGTDDRLTFMATIQNRLIASTKGVLQLTG